MEDGPFAQAALAAQIAFIFAFQFSSGDFPGCGRRRRFPGSTLIQKADKASGDEGSVCTAARSPAGFRCEAYSQRLIQFLDGNAFAAHGVGKGMDKASVLPDCARCVALICKGLQKSGSVIAKLINGNIIDDKIVGVLVHFKSPFVKGDKS
jgi:hypothetical protein